MPLAGIVDLFVMSIDSLSDNNSEHEIYTKPFYAFREAYQNFNKDLVTPLLGEHSRCQKAGYKLGSVSEEFDRRGIFISTTQMIY